jgi:tetratricopeptide (TPR) repeat protein
VILSIGQLEAQARQRLEGLTQSLDSKQKSLADELELRERKLAELSEVTMRQTAELDGALKRANALIPHIESSEVIPSQLYFDAHQTSNQTEKAGLLNAILHHPDSDSNTLEIAGDLARNQLGNRRLARRLYERSIERDPSNVSADSELQVLLVRESVDRESARQRLLNLALANPNHAVVLNNCINAFIECDDYSGLLEFSRKFEGISSQKRLLWRNIAVAHMHLNAPPEEVRSAFDRALQDADEGDFVNAARPYINYLIRTRQLEEALSLVDRALACAPERSELHLLKAQALRLKPDIGRCIESYEWCYRLGDDREKLLASEALKRFELLQALGLTGVLVDAAPPASAEAPPPVKEGAVRDALRDGVAG